MRDDENAHERVLDLLYQEGGAGEASVSRVAAATGVAEARVWGAGHFYSLLGGEPAGVRVCLGLSCRLAGSAEVSDELPDAEYPLILSAERTLYHNYSATQTRRERGPVMKQRGNFIEVHRRDAGKIGAHDGDDVRVLSRRGAVNATAVIGPRVR